MKECEQTAIFKHRTKWLFVTLTQATDGTTLRSVVNGKKMERRYLCLQDSILQKQKGTGTA